jgi:CysZ protein
MPISRSIASALRFTVVVVGVNILVLLLVLLPGINVMAFFVANAYLLGREYFEACASRFHDRETVAALRSAHMTRIFLAGLVVTTVLAIPIVNLLTPLFATAFMMHIFKDVDRQRLLVHA